MKSKVKNITFATFYSCNFANLAESVISQGLSLEEAMASKGKKTLFCLFVHSMPQ